MKQFVATFHTNLAAIRTHKALLAAGISARLAPVPRALSASCGSAVFFISEQSMIECMARDTDALYAQNEAGAYETIHIFE